MTPRWRIAYALDKLPGTCWADLVTWALGWNTRLRDCRVKPVCTGDATANGRCYCGKVARPVEDTP